MIAKLCRPDELDNAANQRLEKVGGDADQPLVLYARSYDG